MILRCEGCGAEVRAADAPLSFQCPRSGDGGDHVLVPLVAPGPFPKGAGNPFVAYRAWLASWALCAENLSDRHFVGIAEDLDARIAEVDGAGFIQTPLTRCDPLGVWVKDETRHVARSHKARHLMGIALYLEVIRALGWIEVVPPLAIASCGNAALAAAVVARAAGWSLAVYVPTSADPAVLERLHALRAEVHLCERRRSEQGDPAFLRFEEAVAAGALPFCVQGPVNGWTLDGGQTLGWEIGAALRREGVALDHLVVQVGGGALASACVRAFEGLAADGVTPMPRIHTVQTEGGWPLRRAYERVKVRAEWAGVEEALRHAAVHRAEYMWPWETEPRSVAHGILDDETYDWHRVVAGMLRTGGEAVIATEAELGEARRLAHEEAGIAATHTGAAGLAGVLALRRAGQISAGEQVAVLFTGGETPAR